MDYDVKTIKTMKKEILPHFLTVYDSEENKHEIVATDGYEIKEENGKYYAVKQKPKYPSSYEECCFILNEYSTQPNITGYKYELLNNFRKLIICLNAYWKIAGKEMGLDVPWEPDWSSKDTKYIIVNRTSVIRLNEVDHYSRVLAFPTMEMRDAFYENFKDLIEKCQKFL